MKKFILFISLIFFVLSIDVYAHSKSNKRIVGNKLNNFTTKSSNSNWVLTVRGELLDWYINDRHIYILCSSDPNQICYVVIIPENQQYNSSGVRNIQLNNDENTEKEVIGPATETVNGNTTTYEFELNE